MYTALVIALMLFGTALLPDLLPAAGFGWDALNGMGLGALVLLVTLAWDSEAPSNPLRLRLHQNLALAAAVLASVHVLGFLIMDPVLLEHLKPTAPVHMLMAMLSYCALLGLVTTSFPGIRRRLYKRYQYFKFWHIGLSALTLTAALWHLIATSSVYQSGIRAGALLLIAGALPTIAIMRRRTSTHDPISPAPADAASADRQSIGLLLCGLMVAVAYTALKNL